MVFFYHSVSRGKEEGGRKEGRKEKQEGRKEKQEGKKEVREEGREEEKQMEFFGLEPSYLLFY